MTREQKTGLIGQAARTNTTISRKNDNGTKEIHPAILGGAAFNMAVVWDQTTQERREYSWYAVKHILNTTNQFNF